MSSSTPEPLPRLIASPEEAPLGAVVFRRRSTGELFAALPGSVELHQLRAQTGEDFDQVALPTRRHVR